MRIGCVAASSRFSREIADRVTAQAAMTHPGVELVFHPDSFVEHGHFAGDDAMRAGAVLSLANDPAIDAIWFARGGYGSCRIAETVMANVSDVARTKRWLGYSDAGSVLAGLYRMGFQGLAHGPMPGDILRVGGEAAVERALDWLTTSAESALEPHLDGRPSVAFNLTILSALMGTALEPDLTGHVLMVEEVSEMLYRIDRTMFHLSGQPGFRRIAGLRLGRVSDVPENDVDFGQSAEEIVRFWCARAGVAYLGEADIGHDAANKVVPFGP